MSMEARGQAVTHGAQFRTIPEKCPYRLPGMIGATHSDLGTVPRSAAFFAGILSHPSIAAQTESKWRIARDRSRQKRGPPSFLG